MKTVLEEFIELIDEDRLDIIIDLEFSISTLTDILDWYEDGDITGDQLAYTSRFILDALQATSGKI